MSPVERIRPLLAHATERVVDAYGDLGSLAEAVAGADDGGWIAVLLRDIREIEKDLREIKDALPPEPEEVRRAG